MPTGDRIKEMREKLRLTQARLGEMTGTDSTTISRWETNKVNVSQKYIGKLASALNTSTDYLLGETDDPTLQSVQTQTELPAERSVVERNRGILTYTSKDGSKVELPDTDRGYALFERILMQKAVMA